MMRIIIIGNCGSGKSTLALKIAQVTQYPLMQLDSIWHKTDYSKEAKINFKTEQKKFLQQTDCIIEGNYNSSIPLRLEQADLIIWLKINKVKAVYRIIKRSIRYRLNNASRAEMPEQYSEHFNHEYWDFLKFVWSYDEKKTNYLLQKYQKKQSRLIIVKKAADKSRVLTYLQREIAK
jgi:adenylate kinase family enzyme